MPIPHRKLYISDAYSNEIDGQGLSPFINEDYWPNSDRFGAVSFRHGSQQSLDNYLSTLTKRPDTQINVLFVDMHVETLRRKDLTGNMLKWWVGTD